jgi:hypothetical protein
MPSAACYRPAKQHDDITPTVAARSVPTFLLTLTTAVVVVVIVSTSFLFLHCNCLRVPVIIAAAPTIAQPAPPCELSRHHLLLAPPFPAETTSTSLPLSFLLIVA